MKRIVLFVSALLVAGIVFGAGQSDEGASAEGVEVTPPGEYPIVREPVTLEVMIVDPGTDYEDNRFTRWLEERTGVVPEFVPVPRRDSMQKLNIVVASGDLPEVLVGWRLQAAQIAELGSLGVLVPLNDYIDDVGYHIPQWMERYPSIRSQITALDGNIYSIPMFNQCYHCSMGNKLWINEAWLRALDLPMPETTEELYRTLLAFKERDPNGNGVADEVPLSAAQAHRDYLNSVYSIIPVLMNPFVDVPSGFNNQSGMVWVDDGRVTVSYRADGWREGLRFIQRLYRADLLDPESFIMDRQQLTQLAESEVQVLGAAPGLENPAQYLSESGYYRDYTVVPSLAGPSGQRYSSWNPYAGVQPGRFMITSAARNPEVAFRWADTFWDTSYEATLRAFYGDEGSQWRWASSDEVGINGERAVWAQIPQPDTDVTLNRDGWGSTPGTFRDAAFRLGRVRSGDPHDVETVLFEQTRDKLAPYRPDIAMILPPIQFTTQEAEVVTDIETTINRFVVQATAEFIVGTRDIDREWEQYVDDLNRMGLDELIRIYQIAYDRYRELSE